MVPSISLTTATPAVMATNTTAKPTDNADVYLNESSITTPRRKGNKN
jgi:hypothetical protein